MTIHVNIGEAKTRLSELIVAAQRGEEVIVSKAGEPQVRLIPVAAIDEARRDDIARSRAAAFGMYSHLIGDRDIDIRSLKMTDAEQDESHVRKFGPPR